LERARTHTAANEIINLLALLFIAPGVQPEKLLRPSAHSEQSNRLVWHSIGHYLRKVFSEMLTDEEGIVIKK
jgi:hypothetical protein